MIFVVRSGHQLHGTSTPSTKRFPGCSGLTTNPVTCMCAQLVLEQIDKDQSSLLGLTYCWPSTAIFD